MVIHWSIFTLSIQLIYCASVYSNIDSSPSESICSHETDRQVNSEGKESSLTLELHPDIMSHGPCKRILTAPESHGFFMHLVRNSVRKTQSNGPPMKNIRGMSPKIRNSTHSCPLSIYSTNDPVIPSWKVDPCQLELQDEKDEPVRLLQGRVRIVWDHGGNIPAYKLVVTVIGKGLPCQRNNKHPCLRFGQETLLCISKDLVCDGVRHCPKGNEYDSDEDYALCSKRKQGNHVSDPNIWEHFTIEIFRNLFNSDNGGTSTSTTKIDPRGDGQSSTSVKDFENDVKRNNTKGTLTGDLSRYGPWGYLMLGMLLCGGALLICGLWECCCRQSKTTDPNLDGTNPNGGQAAQSQVNSPTTPDPSPPNYDELDPPPAYSVLFPNQKSSTNQPSSSTNDANSGTDSTPPETPS